MDLENHHHLISDPEQSYDQPLEPTESSEESEAVRTLFVSGLPLDVKYREVYNLFRHYPGFVSVTLSYAGVDRKLPVSFPIFSDQSGALKARDALQGLQFDPDSPVTLRIELAKSNSKSKRRRGPNDTGGQAEKRFRPSSSLGDPYSSSYSSSSSQYSAFNDVNSVYSGYGYIGDHLNPYIMGPATPPAPRERGAFPPCSTLFVGNLSPNTNEKEIEDLFRSFPGYEKLKVARKEDSIVCFIEFQNVQCSTQALNSLQGVILQSSDRGGIRIEYARHRMGENPIKGPFGPSAGGLASGIGLPPRIGDDGGRPPM